MVSLKMSLSVLAILFVLSTISTSAQNTASCAEKLIPCAAYLNGTTKPPSSCCDPIKEAVEKDLPCLCSLYNTPGLLQGFGVNVTQALALTQRCGTKADTSACSKASAPSGSTPPPPAASYASSVSWTGLWSIVFLVFASLLF
ncbi:hypothetical protein K2173_005389 [Erythroxylum novogranatense]|uniref:Bifunctional inhibitor/plant lipid transfer protein/seed storage helical domain-containing protein n=1 Tax=Erythroxylum novogranatense TaxID=1862640 RepID=A0AAV8TD52_9ROSI|nr:hypothetical protein K2173_005389 [Erythroxylum novogranatense]